MNILVTGATGYIGGRLIPRLVEAGHRVRAFARDSERLAGRFDRVDVFEGDLFEREQVRAALDGIEIAYYLVHSMSKSGDFAERDLAAAKIFSEAARDAGVRRIVYLGGLGVDDEKLSHHLRSRHETGAMLRVGGIPVTEFRAAIIVGSGSASFEMLRYLTERLPVMIAPRWVSTPCQPIAVRDVLAYLVAEAARAADASEIFEIGGADVLSYREMMLRYAKIRGLKRSLLVVPFFTPRLSSGWVHLVTPIPSTIARPLIDGLRSRVVVEDDSARRVFPNIEPVGYDDAVRRALDRYSTVGPETTWFDAYDVKKLPGNFTGTEQGMLIDRRQATADASPQSLFDVFTRLGGKRGWLYADGLWELRGVLDRLVGGIGTRRGRRSEDSIRVGDAVDFWRVESYEKDRLLRLRAEMRLPGYAWLQFEALPGDGPGESRLRQTAFFEPRGFFGYAYWFGVLPFHEFIFGNMAKRIAREAEAREVAASSDPLVEAQTATV
jgi:uncharacterized protein YbjT (DUF2867 family)